MKIKLFIAWYFWALLLIYVTTTEPYEYGKQFDETEESKTNTRVDGHAIWPGGGAVWHDPYENANKGGGENTNRGGCGIVINFSGGDKCGGGGNVVNFHDGGKGSGNGK